MWGQVHSGFSRVAPRPAGPVGSPRPLARVARPGMRPALISLRMTTLVCSEPGACRRPGRHHGCVIPQSEPTVLGVANCDQDLALSAAACEFRVWRAASGISFMPVPARLTPAMNVAPGPRS